MLVDGRNNKQLRSRYKGIMGPYIHNNIGVSQGSPIIAQLYIIYDGYVMRISQDKSKYKKLKCDESDIRSNKAESHRDDAQYRQIPNNQDGNAKINDNLIIHNAASIYTNYPLFYDDKRLDIINISDTENNYIHILRPRYQIPSIYIGEGVYSARKQHPKNDYIPKYTTSHIQPN